MLRVLGFVCVIIGAAACAASAAAMTIRIGLPSFPPNNGDPFEATARISILTARAVYDTLAQLDDAMRPAPSLALSWQNTDPNTWIVKLRPNVSFSNGERLTADAVVFSYDFLKTPEAKPLIMSAEVENIASVRARDNLTVEFKTRQPEAGFPRRLAIVPIVPPVYFRKIGHEGYVRAPIGTGPFIIDSLNTARIDLHAFKGSWRAPIADKLELLNLPVPTARLQALLSKRIDVAGDIGPDNIDTLTSGGFAIYQRPVSSVDVMTLNALLPGSPFKDVRVRQALNYAIDRQAIAAQILHGRVPPASQVVARINPDYDPSIAPYPYDPKKAKDLLAEAGYPNGFSFAYEMNNAGGADMAAVMEQVANSLAQVGVRMEIRGVPRTQIVRNVRQGGWQAEAFGLEYEVLPTGDTLWPFRLHSCTWPQPWYCDETVTSLMAEAKTTFDSAQRLTLIHAILKRTQEQAAVVALFEPVGLDALSPGVVGYSEVFGNISYQQLAIRP